MRLETNSDPDDVFSSNSSSCFNSSPTTKTRPTMISAKYRLKEERRKVLKISISKLKKIEDPESSLRRSVLINNTMKRLQREAREEKMLKSQPSLSSQSTSSLLAKDPTDLCLDVVDLPCIETEDKENASPQSSKVELNCEEILTSTSTSSPSSSTSSSNSGNTLDLTDTITSTSSSNTTMNTRRKRHLDDMDESDVQDVLSQFYMPPTPRMLTSIDDDESEDVNVVDIDIDFEAPTAKRPRDDSMQMQQPPWARTTPLPYSSPSTSFYSTQCIQPSTSSSFMESTSLISSTTSMSPNNDASPEVNQQYSCGHSSMFGEMQTVVFQSLITSLES